MVFSFFKKRNDATSKPEEKSPQAEAVTSTVPPSKPAPVQQKPDVKPAVKAAPTPTSAAIAPPNAPPIPAAPKPVKPKPEATKPVTPVAPKPAAASASALDDDDFYDFDDFDNDLLTTSALGISMDVPEDAAQGDIDHAVMMYANGDTAAVRQMLEYFLQDDNCRPDKRYWRLLFDLYQIQGNRDAFEALAIDFARQHETSPPTWREPATDDDEKENTCKGEDNRVHLSGIMTEDNLSALAAIDNKISSGEPLVLDFARLASCDDVIADKLANYLITARLKHQPITVGHASTFTNRLCLRVNVGDAKHEPVWLLLLELLQRIGTLEEFEARAIDYAVTFGKSPPSWEESVSQTINDEDDELTPSEGAAIPSHFTRSDAFAMSCKGGMYEIDLSPEEMHYFSGEIKDCRFDDLTDVLNFLNNPVLNFAQVTRLDFYSAGQLASRLSPYVGTGKKIVIFHPNHFVAELMRIIGITDMATIVMCKV